MYASVEQKQKYLPLLTSGEWGAALCISEDISGSDPRIIETLATKSGDSFIVNGKKLWVTNASKANLFIVLIKVQVSQFLHLPQ